MRRRSLLMAIIIGLLAATSHAQAPGPYYFVSDKVPGPEQFYGGGTDSYGGCPIVENYNLLATLLGDEPSRLVRPGQRLVAPETFTVAGRSPRLQAFAYTQGGSNKKENLLIGPKLQSFLGDPLGGAAFDLTLPFSDSRVALSNRSALLRVGDGSSADWHTAVDLDRSDDTTLGFDVVAPADGIVEGLGRSTLCLRHTAANGRDFLTVYSHLAPESLRHLREGLAISRGQALARIATGNGYAHLHFGVAVQGPAGVVNGTDMPALWYLIDPFGVYDYRRQRFDDAAYNYLPNDTLKAKVRGIHHAYVWRTNPPIGSLPLKEDCVEFDPAALDIHPVGDRKYVLNAGSRALFEFPDMLEAGNALSVIRKHGFTASCFVGRPEPSLQYLR